MPLKAKIQKVKKLYADINIRINRMMKRKTANARLNFTQNLPS